MKFEVRNRYTGDVQFTAEIDCDSNTPIGLKLKLAVKWAISNEADLRGANLSGADLRGADLRGANLSGADLRWTDLRGADLSGTDLRWTDLRWTDLRGADLRWTDLRGADLRCYKSDIYECFIQKEYMQIGCERHSWDDWLSFDDKRILSMAGKKALKWWRINKPILEAIRDSI